MTESTKISRKYVAYHEATHVAAYIATRRTFKLVTIVPDGNGAAGHVKHRTITRRVAYSMSSKGLLDHAFIALAAPAQDQYRHGLYDEDCCQSDINDALDFIGFFPDMQEAYDQQWARAMQFVMDPRQMLRIKAIAHALIQHETLIYIQVQKTLDALNSSQSRIRRTSK